MAPNGVELHSVATNGVELNVAVAGDGPPVLLLHGWPHTWRLWSLVIPRLARDHRVVAPDLRGLGASTRAASGYDLHTLAQDAAGLLDALGATRAAVVGIDAGAPVAFMLALRDPARVRRLVLMESLLGRLPGAEEFLAGGPPWWFGFHAVPDLAETVLLGHEAEYIAWFLTAGTARGRGIDAGIRDAFVRAYSGREALRCGFAYYRSLGVNAQQIADAVASGPLAVPTLAIAGGVVGDALHRQLEPIAAELTGHQIEDCGHIVPLEQPDALFEVLTPYLA